MASPHTDAGKGPLEAFLRGCAETSALPAALDSLTALTEHTPIPLAGCSALARILQEQRSSRPRVCEAVRQLLAKSEVNAFTAVDPRSDLPAALIAALVKRDGIDDPVVIAACRALANLAITAGGQTRLIDGGAIPVLLGVLHSAPPAGVAAAAGALLNLADNEAGRARIIASGGVSATRRALASASPDSSLLAETTCGLLWNLAASADGAAAILGGDCLPLLVGTLKHHAASSYDVVEAVCGALCNLASSSPEGQMACLEAGAFAGVLAAVWAAEASADPTSYLPLPLETLAALSDRGKGRGAPVHGGAFPVLQRVIVAHRGAPRVVTGACRAVWFLSRLDANKQAAVDVGLRPLLFDIIVKEAAAAPAATGGILPASYAFLNLRRTGDLAAFRDMAARPDAVPAILGAVSAFTAEADFVTASAVCRALLCLGPEPGEDDVGFRPTLPQAGLVSLVTVFVDALRTHAADAAAVDAIAAALRYVAEMGGSRARRAISSCGGIDLLVSALHHHATDTFAPGSVCVTLWTLLIGEDEVMVAEFARPARVAAVVDGALAALASPRSEGPVRIDLTDAACGLLASIASHVTGERLERCAHALVGVLGTPALASVPRICIIVGGFMTNMRHDPAEQDAFLRAGAVARLAATLHEHRADAEVASRTVGVVASFARTARAADAFAAEGPAFFDDLVGVLGLHGSSVEALEQVRCQPAPQEQRYVTPCHAPRSLPVCQIVGAVMNLAGLSDRSEAALVSAGIIPALLAVLRAHAGDQELVANAIRALMNSTRDAAHARIATRADATEVVASLRRRYSAEPEITDLLSQLSLRLREGGTDDSGGSGSD